MSGKRIIGIIVVLALVAGAAFGVASIIRENRITALRNHGAALCRNGQYEEAREIFIQFDDDVAKSWVLSCDRGITENRALALLAEGKSAEAYELLKTEYPESNRLNEVTAAYANELSARGNAAAALRMLEEENHPDGRLRRTIEEAADEQAFWRSLENRDLEASLAAYRAVKDRHPYADETTDRKLSDMLLAYQKAEAASLLERGEYLSAFKRYEELGDEAGMSATLDAAEAAGNYLIAFRCIAESEKPDVPRLTGLYGRLTEAEYRPVNNSAFSHFDSSGRLNYYNVDIGSLIGKLLGMNDAGATELAARIADGVVAECRPLISEGARRRAPYAALGELKRQAGSLWTDELEALMNSCVEMPENCVLTDKNGLQAEPGSPDSATVTLNNRSSTKGAVLQLRRTIGSPAGIVNIFVRPGTSFAVTVRAGNYEAYVWQGRYWYGSEEYFGNPAERQAVEIYDTMHRVTTDLLNGIALITVN